MMPLEARVVFIETQVVAARAELAAMEQANRDRFAQALAPAYGEAAFREVIEKYHLDAGEVLSYLDMGEYPPKGGAT